MNKSLTIIIILILFFSVRYFYNYKEIVYLDALDFKQSSFTPKDIEELEKLIEKKEETK